MSSDAAGGCLILLHSDDAIGLWTYHGLETLGFGPLHLVTAEDLTANARWQHRLDSDGASVEVMLGDGRLISNRRPAGVLNRLLWAPVLNLASVVESDRNYGVQEWGALFLSWLRCFTGPVLNRPSARGLSGANRHVSEWLCLAAGSGLPTVRYAESSESLTEAPEAHGAAGSDDVRSVIVLGRRLFGSPCPDQIGAACVQLARVAEVGLLELRFIVRPDSWAFCGAASLPDLRVGGRELLQALADELAGAWASVP